MHCPCCQVDLGKQETITAIHGGLLCNACAKLIYSKEILDSDSEEIIPEDVGILADNENSIEGDE